jgi:hypothetical protein
MVACMCVYTHMHKKVQIRICHRMQNLNQHYVNNYIHTHTLSFLVQICKGIVCIIILSTQALPHVFLNLGICMYVCMYVCMCMYASSYFPLRLCRTYSGIWALVCMYVCKHVAHLYFIVSVLFSLPVCPRLIHVCIHAYMYVYTHTCIYMPIHVSNIGGEKNAYGQITCKYIKCKTHSHTHTHKSAGKKYLTQLW